MKKIRIFPLCMALVLLLCSLVACKDPVEDVLTPAIALTKATAALESTPYTVEMEMELSCEDPTYASLFEVREMDVVMKVKGEDFLLDMQVSEFANMTITCVGDTAYYLIYTFGQYNCKKTLLTDAQKNELFAQKGASLGIEAKDFANLSLQKGENGEIIIDCTDLSSDAMAKLVEESLGDLSAEGMHVSVKNVSMQLEIEHDRYDSIELVATYLVVIGDQSFELGMKIDMDYDYSAFAPITAPENADSYKLTTYESLFGK